MEERVPSSTDDSNTNHNRSIIPDPQKIQDPNIPAIGPGTYIVQVPKNQVYRVPPPENAIIVQQHRGGGGGGGGGDGGGGGGGGGGGHQKNSFLSMLFWIFASIFSVVLVLVFVALLIYLIVNPSNPTFSVTSFTVKNNTQPSSHKHHQPQPPHLYTIILKSQNPNEGMGIFYQEGGDVKLSFKEQQIAAGKLPPLYQGYKDLKTFRVSLTGANTALPHEIQKSMKDEKSKASIPFSLSVTVPVKMRIGLIKTWSLDMDISCNFRVDTLTKNIHVLSQICDTAIHA